MPLPSPLRAVIFDMDGLLIDSERIATQCWIKAALGLNLTFPTELSAAMAGMHTKKIPEFLWSKLGQDYPALKVAKRCHEIYLATTASGVPIKAGVTEILDFLESHHIPTAVATSSTLVSANHHLKQADIYHRFQFIVTSEEVNQAKPAPDIYLLATQKLGIYPANAIALEDSEYGIRSALSAGLWGIMVPDQKQPSEEIRALGHPIVQDLHAAQKLISQML
jgi:HAD superfamily hydrolase (TIGR01509 family)